MSIAETILKLIITVGIFWIVSNNSVESLVKLIAAYLIVLGLWRAHGFSGALLDLRLAKNDLERARAESERSKAARVLTIPGVSHEVILIHNGTHDTIPITPAPVVTQTGETITAEEHKTLAALSQLVELSIAQFGTEGRQIMPAQFSDGKIGVKWQTVIDYAASKGYVYTSNEGTFCKNKTPNLAALRLAVAFNALPHR